MWDNAIGEKRAGLHVIGSSEVPLYLYRIGNEWALFEGGLTGMGPTVLAQLQAIVGDLGTIRHWFITHAHYDHYGLLPYLSAHLEDITVYASESGIRGLNSKRAREVAASLNADMASEWQFDTDTETLTELFHQHTVGKHFMQRLDDGSQVELGAGNSVTAIATPGHSRCSMSYLIEPAGILLSSDALGDLVTEREFLPLIFDSFSDYRTSLDTLSTLSPAVVGLGHHGTLNGSLAKSAARDARDCLDRFTAELWEEEATATAASRFADSLTQRHWDGSHRFITRDLHNKSMLRMYELIIDAKENGNG